MPNLLVNQIIVNDVFTVQFSIQQNTLSQADQALIAKFGEPSINTGGSFGEEPNQYTLPAAYINVVSGLPFTQLFDPSNSIFTSNPQIKAEAYVSAFIATYTAAFTTLRENSDTWTSQQIENI